MCSGSFPQRGNKNNQTYYNSFSIPSGSYSLKHKQNGFLEKSLPNPLNATEFVMQQISDKIPDTSCSEYPSDLEETGLSADVQNIPLRGLWPDGES